MSVCYLDVQDEITDAVARLRAAPDYRVIVVLPPGSRIGTSRINFRLLLREAEGRGLTLELVSGEAEVRALALSAGLRSYASVADAERSADEQPLAPNLAPAQEFPPAARGATAGGVAAPRGAAGAAGTAAAVGAAAQRPSTTQTPVPPGQVPGQPPLPAYLAPHVDPRWVRTETGGFAVTPRAATGGRGPAEAAWTGDLGQEQSRGRRRGRRRLRRIVGWTVRLTVVALLVGGLAYGAYLYLPTATVSLTPGTQPFGPLTLTITADPDIAIADPQSGKVPAEHVPIPLAASGTFPATGSEVSQSRAQGSVILRSKNTVTQVVVPQGTLVSTADGVEFETVDQAILPKANFDTGEPGSDKVSIRAVRPGPSGNVDPGMITTVPTALSDQRVEATNEQATTGGRRDVIATVTREDYNVALSQLTADLRSDLEAALTDPVTTPRGLTLYPETADLGRISASAAAGDVVGTSADSFELGVDSQATVLAVDEALVASVAADQLEASAPPGVRVFPETITTQLSPGTVDGRIISYEVVAEARQYTPVDAAKLEESIRGKTLSEARSILEPFGKVVLTVWPDFVPTIPDDSRRINLTVENPEIPR